MSDRHCSTCRHEALGKSEAPCETCIVGTAFSNWQPKGTTTAPADPYASLKNVLDRAFAQAAEGKGAERHANGLSFEQQPMQTISDSLGTNAGLLFQAAKKAQESQRMAPDAAVRELLGAINYLAGAVVWLERRQ